MLRGSLVGLVCVLCLALGLASHAGPADDLISHWQFDEGEGLVTYHASLEGRTGNLLQPLWAAGISGQALDFDGVSDYVDFKEGEGYPEEVGELSVGTISVWFTFESVPPVWRIHPIFYLGDGQQPPASINSAIVEVGHYQTSTKVYFTVILEGTTTLCFDSDFDLEIGRWYHFAAVVGEDFNTGYLDGEELTERHYNFGGPGDRLFLADVPEKRAMWAGRGFLNGVDFDQRHHGRIDELRIYDRPLSAGEIERHYETLPEPGAAGLRLLACAILALLARRRRRTSLWGTGCPANEVSPGSLLAV